MQSTKFSKTMYRLRMCVVAFILTLVCLLLFSFSVRYATEDFLQQLGISKTEADKKIIHSVLGGYLDQYGVKNAKNILKAKKAAITTDLLLYTKKQVESPSFLKAYLELKESNKPQVPTIETPETMQKNMVEALKKSLAEAEQNAKKADASIKQVFENVVVESKKQLKDAEDPNNKFLTAYRKNYEEMLKNTETSNQQQLMAWENEYPQNVNLFIKRRLEAFLQETNDIDFDAQLVEKNGKKYFVNSQYERKSNRWKMAFRAGPEVIITARNFVAEWLKTLQ